MDGCRECGLVYADIPRDEIGRRLGALAHSHADALRSTPADVLRAHPHAGVWSALEYACHVRDVLRVQRERVLLALAEDEPRFEPMGREERVVDDRYNEEDPARVAAEVEEAAAALAETLARLDDAAWVRTGIYSWPTEQPRTMEWVGRHTVHECLHHLTDLQRQVAAATTRER